MKEPVSSSILDGLHSPEKMGKAENQGQTRRPYDLYQVFFEQAPEALLVMDSKGNFVEINSRASTMFGYAREELLQLNIKAFPDLVQGGSHPLDLDHLTEFDPISKEGRVLHKDGRVLYVEFDLRRYLDDSILLTVRDNAHRKIAEKGLRNTGANLRIFFEKIDTVNILTDSQLQIRTFNPFASEFAKRELENRLVVGDFLVDYFPEEKKQVILNLINGIIDGKTVQCELSFLQPDGLLNWYKIKIFTVRMEEDSIPGLIFSMSDITDMKMLENLQVNRKVQEQKNYMRAVLKEQEIERNNIGQELHDNVNQMLSTIRLYLGMIESEETMRLELINKSKAAIDLVIEEIRLISRHQVTPQRKFDLTELIEDLIRNLNENTRVSIKFEVRVSIDYPVDEDLKLNIYRIVQEQINNILKHAAATKVSISIEVQKEILFLKIKDNGVGFDPLLKRKGIGISNIFNRVESYNGEMAILSKPGGGCKLEIAIPNTLHAK